MGVELNSWKNPGSLCKISSGAPGAAVSPERIIEVILLLTSEPLEAKNLAIRVPEDQ